MRLFDLALASLLVSGLAALSLADEPASKDETKQGKKVSGEEINRLVKQLGDDDFQKRAEARKRLEAIGEPAIEILRKAAESSDDAETRSAAKQIIEAFARKNSGLLRVFEKHGERVNGVAISKDGKRGLSVCWDGVLRYWNLENGDLIREIKAHPAGINSVALSPDGKRALTGGRDNSMRLWQLDTGKEIRAFQGFGGRLWDIAFSPDGKKALVSCNDGITSLWELDSGNELQSLESHKGGRAWTVAFTKDGKQAITGGGNHLDQPGAATTSLRLWDLETGKEIRQFKGHTLDVRGVAISPSGKQLLSASFDGTMRLWDIETGKELKRFEGPGNFVEAVCFTPDGKRALCSYGPRTADALFDADPRCNPRLWDLATGKELKQFIGHLGPVLSLAISGDGRFFVSGSADQTMRLWQLPK